MHLSLSGFFPSSFSFFLLLLFLLTLCVSLSSVTSCACGGNTPRTAHCSDVSHRDRSSEEEACRSTCAIGFDDGFFADRLWGEGRMVDGQINNGR